MKDITKQDFGIILTAFIGGAFVTVVACISLVITFPFWLIKELTK